MPHQCGDCTMCCKLLGVEELHKPPNDWCEHCDIGVGCRIYHERPTSCRQFECAWLQNEDWPDDLRPDRSRVVIWLPDTATAPQNHQYQYQYQVHIDPLRPNAWNEGKMALLLNAIIQSGNDIMLTIGMKRKFLTINPESAKRFQQVIKALKDCKGSHVDFEW